ncbi:hypothetical protein RHSIM_Rhsim05G0017500 [Rhododendron simsii]|uniref:BHLH domain-containing protein n=1 Tax=Rhododendron simsii TaxID=118357 RepID=A0A834GVF3_RHOSS|nr:hypothetical protein RHSIM_Rhsim05G0017500 [Rhododendron simsii]
MKVSSLPNLNRETTSFPNFFTIIQDPADHHHHHDTGLQIDEHSCDTEASETSPYKAILSPSVSFDQTNEIGFPAGTSSVGMFRSESEHNDQTRPNSVSVGSNQFGGSEWPNLPSCGGNRATSPISQETIEQPFSPLCPTKRAFTQIDTFQFLEIKEATMTEAGTSKSSRRETPAPLPPFKGHYFASHLVRKERLADKITALHQLVSPFGKADTASVLLEAMEYIKFLHEQVNALSIPFMKSGASMQLQQNPGKSKEDEGPKQDLRSKGLCLMPISNSLPTDLEIATTPPSTCAQIDERSCDTETSPYKDILSPFDEMNEIRLFAATSSVGLIRHESVQTQHNTSSVGSNQFGGGSATSGSVGPNPAQLRELDPVINNKDTMLRLAIPVRQRVAVCIWWLATGEPLRRVSKKFGLGISTCRELVLEVCGAIWSVLMSKFLKRPDEEKMTKVKWEFELISGIPNVGGSIYTTHVPVIEPEVSAPAYFNKSHTERNQKMSYSITVQGVVDSKGVFTDACIGWPGSMSDDKILENSALSQLASGGLLKDVWIVGNSGYPLMDWMLVPYAHKPLTWSQHTFNVKVGEVQRVAKEAFLRLKGRWSCLQKRIEVKPWRLPVVLGAACVLHNICEMRNEAMDPAETSFNLFDDEIVPEINSVRRRCSGVETLLFPTLSLGLSCFLQILTSPPPRFRFTLQFETPSSNLRTNPKMKVSSLPNLNRETTSFPNFFTLFQHPADHHHHDTALQIDERSCDTEASETSPYKDILSPFNEMNEIRLCAGTSSVGLIRRESVQTQHNTSSVGSNQFSGGGSSATSGSVGPNPAQLRWWDQCSHPDFPESEFRRAFKMSKSTFQFICSELDPVISKDNTMLRLAIPLVSQIIPVRQCVAVCIWWLATGEPLRLVSQKFGLGISTCRELVLVVCGAIRSVLMSKFLNWPDEEKMTTVKREFELLSGIPNVAGSIYTTHVPINEPEVNGPAYFNKRHTERNQKMSYSITVQGVVDSKGVFTDVCIGWPGSTSDDKILENSALSQRASGGLLKDVWIVGNRGYPLMDWVLVPYAQPIHWCSHMVFNESVGVVQKVAKKAFSRLKGRWRCLQKITEVMLQDLPVVLGACCVLHNLCEMRNEALMDSSETSFDLFDDVIVPENDVRSVDAMRARDQIALWYTIFFWASTFPPFD